MTCSIRLVALARKRIHSGAVIDTEPMVVDGSGLRESRHGLTSNSATCDFHLQIRALRAMLEGISFKAKRSDGRVHQLDRLQQASLINRCRASTAPPGRSARRRRECARPRAQGALRDKIGRCRNRRSCSKGTIAKSNMAIRRHQRTAHRAGREGYLRCRAEPREPVDRRTWLPNRHFTEAAPTLIRQGRKATANHQRGRVYVRHPNPHLRRLLLRRPELHKRTDRAVRRSRKEAKGFPRALIVAQRICQHHHGCRPHRHFDEGRSGRTGGTHRELLETCTMMYQQIAQSS